MGGRQGPESDRESVDEGGNQVPVVYAICSQDGPTSHAQVTLSPGTRVEQGFSFAGSSPVQGGYINRWDERLRPPWGEMPIRSESGQGTSRDIGFYVGTEEKEDLIVHIR